MCVLFTPPAVAAVQELTQGGVYVRMVGVGVIRNSVLALAASPDLILCADATDSGILLAFDVTTGALLRSFGEAGYTEGCLKGVRGLRFSPDGTLVVVAEYLKARVSVFTTTGAFVRCVGVGASVRSHDVDFGPDGDILVADVDHHRVAVFALAGPPAACFFGVSGLLRFPTALAVRGDALYVLSLDSDRVQVFA